MARKKRAIRREPDRRATSRGDEINGQAPPHPGIELRQTLELRRISESQIAKALRTSLRTINHIICGRRALTVDKACRLARFLDVNPRFWLSLQMELDIWICERALEAEESRTSRPHGAGKRPDVRLLPKPAKRIAAGQQSEA